MKLILVCLLALSALALGLPPQSIKIRNLQRKKPLVGIYGTQLAHIQKYPYTVSTYTHYHYLAVITGSGTILNHNWILCTSTQLNYVSVTDVNIRGGSDDGQTGGQTSGIVKIISNYTGDWSTDIALLKTKKKLKFNKKLRPVKLATTLPKEGSTADLSGFGKNGIRSGVLSAGKFKISSYSDCKKYYASDTILCSESDEYTPAFDDLGDPFVQKNQLVGYYSGDDGWGPYTFMAISKLRYWIIEKIKQNSEGDEAAGIDDDDFDFDAYENDDDDDDSDEDENSDEDEDRDDDDDSDDDDESDSSDE